MIPKYIKLKETINEKILTGEYPLGSKLPTEIQLAQEYAVSRSTVRQALELLEESGIISKHWGSGNTVMAKSDTSKKNIVRLIVPLIKSPIYGDYIEDIQSVLLKDGFQVEILETKGRISLEREYLLEMQNEMYAGLIIAPAKLGVCSTNEDLLQILLKRQTPILFINSAPANIYNPAVIKADDYSRGYQMARSFINEGHKNLGGIFLQDEIASTTAFSGFVDAIRDANLPILDSCFLFCNSVDYPGMESRTNSSINKFLKAAFDTASVIYVDDNTLYTDELFPVNRCTVQPSKPFGKEIAKAFLQLCKRKA